MTDPYFYEDESADLAAEMDADRRAEDASEMGPDDVGLWSSAVQREPHPIGQCDDDECDRCWNPPG